MFYAFVREGARSTLMFVTYHMPPMCAHSGAHTIPHGMFDPLRVLLLHMHSAKHLHRPLPRFKVLEGPLHLILLIRRILIQAIFTHFLAMELHLNGKWFNTDVEIFPKVKQFFYCQKSDWYYR